MKKEFQDNEKEIRQETPPIHYTENLDEAIKRLYAQYGNDLQAFFRDAYRKSPLTFKKRSVITLGPA
jgi:hypothetical protein